MHKALSLICSIIFIALISVIDGISLSTILLGGLFSWTIFQAFTKACTFNTAIKVTLVAVAVFGELLIVYYSDGVNRLLISGVWLLLCYYFLFNLPSKHFCIKPALILNLAICVLILIPTDDIDGANFSMPRLGIASKFNIMNQNNDPVKEIARRYVRHSEVPLQVKLNFPHGADAFPSYILNIQVLQVTNIMISSIHYFEKVGFLAVNNIVTTPLQIDNVSVNDIYKNSFKVDQNELFIEHVRKAEPLDITLNFPSAAQIKDSFSWKNYLLKIIIALITWQLLWCAFYLICPTFRKRNVL